ncbi:MAG: hypothetical protein JNM72_05680 [Deltaproteobacteria bacterium]|nr:hypothetical protein [Deltaproteobacteria bacterium]
MRRALWAAALLGVGAPAAAGQTSTFTPEGASCEEVGLIAGTAGVRNAADAIQRQANTYSASAFAARHLDRERVGAEDGLLVVMDLNTTYNATRMPVFHRDAVDDGMSEVGDCVAKNRVAMRGLDMQAGNFGLTYNKGPVGLIFATSLTAGFPAYGDQFTRVNMNSFVAPAYVVGIAATAPLLDLLIPGDLDLGAIKLDYLLGARVDAKLVQASAAWLGSKGGYAQLSEPTFGGYAFVAKSIGEAAVWQAGVDRLDPGGLGAADLGEALGLTSLAYQQLPYSLAAPGGAALPVIGRLRVTGAQQQNIARVADLAVRYRIEPEASLSELAMGLHTPGYHKPRVRDDDEDDVPVGLLARGGFVSTPAVWSQGLAAARLPSGRVELNGEADDFLVRLAFLYNDPEQLQLYPFARGALSYQLTLRGDL